MKLAINQRLLHATLRLPLRAVIACGLMVAFSSAARSCAAFELEGFTEPFRTIDVAADETGTIAEVFVREGQSVEERVPLARLNSDVYEALLAITVQNMQAKGRLEAALAEVKLRGDRLQKLRVLKSVFRLIPGLEHCEFLRWGSIHRNAYLNFPACLTPHGSLEERPDLIFAGQLTGVEGYTESAASGILAGINLGRVLRGEAPVVPPPTTMLGGLFRYLREAEVKRFQPMNSNWGLVDPLNKRVRDKVRKREMLAERAETDFRAWMEASGIGTGQIAASGGVGSDSAEDSAGSSAEASGRTEVPLS